MAELRELEVASLTTSLLEHLHSVNVDPEIKIAALQSAADILRHAVEQQVLVATYGNILRGPK